MAGRWRKLSCTSTSIVSVASLSRQPTRQVTDVGSLLLVKLLGDRELKDVVNPRLFAL